MGHAAELFGVATLLLALAFVVLPILVSRGGIPVVAWVSGCLLGITFAIQGVHTLRSGLMGYAADSNLIEPILYVQLVLLPIVLVAMLVNRRGRNPRPNLNSIALMVLIVSLTTTHPFIRIILDIGPFDSRPFSEATFGVALVIAALALWPATRPRAAADPGEGRSAPDEALVGAS